MSIVSLSRVSVQSVFAEPRKNGQYLYDRSTLSTSPSEGNISIPLVVDTEFRSMPVHWTKGTPKGRLGLTTQIKGIYASEGVIFAHPQFAEHLKRFPVATTGFHPCDYLKHLGHDVKLERSDLKSLKGLPDAEFVLYAFFALAELMMIVEGDYEEDFKSLCATSSTKKPRFEMTRRVRAVTPGNRGDADTVELPWKMTLNGVEYAVSVSIIDTGAIHGNASYADFCSAAGVKLSSKDNFTPKQKGKMDLMAQQRPEDFDSYALGDLEVYEALKQNSEKFREIYQALGIVEAFQPPRLTIGSTVRDLFMAALCSRLGVDSGDLEAVKTLTKNYLEPASAQHLRQNPKSTSSLSAKVEGGRCRNNRPTAIAVEAPLADIDISGCYGEGQRNQMYFIGRPEVLEFPTDSDCNQYWTLRQFLKEYEKDLVSGAWFARVSTSAPLKHRQDFFASWFLPGGHSEDIMAKYVQRMKSDTEQVDLEFDEEDGNLKIFNHEILNGTLTHDGLQWIMQVASAHQRKELLDKLLVKVAVIYPKSWQVQSYEELQSAYKNHKGRNTRQRVAAGGGKRKLRAEDGECHAWLGINIGELLIDDLIANRKMHPKKTPLNTLYKLCINTLYGDMTSKFFTCANVVVGNNITARARSLAWYMEKGLNGFQTITDGCTFELNRVVFPREDREWRINGSNLVNLYQETDPTAVRDVVLAPLGGRKILKVDCIERKYVEDGEKKTELVPILTFDDETQTVLKGQEALSWIDRTAMEHLQTLFPGVDVLNEQSTSLKPKADEAGKPVKTYVPRRGQFEFETKLCYTSGVFHGTANYLLANPVYQNLKMRAYENKKHHDSVVEGGRDDRLGRSRRYGGKNTPATDFISQLAKGKLTRQVPFVKEAILKISDYKNRFETWESLGLVPGDSFYKPGLLREFSLSQFTFKSFQQWRDWEKALTRAKEIYGQSLEDLFTDEEGILDYPTMIFTVDRLIASQEVFTEGLSETQKSKTAKEKATSEGKFSPLATLRDPHGRESRKRHPHYGTYLRLKDQLSTPAE